MADQWEEQAKQFKGAPATGQAVAAAPSDDWKVWQAGNEPQQTQSAIPNALKNFGIGVGKGAASTVSNIDNAVAKIPYVGKWLTTPLAGNGTSEQARTQLQQASEPQNTAQSIGKGAEQIGEFFVPGAGEEAMGEKLATLAPKAGTAMKIIPRALSQGIVNKAQGGSFTGGAVAGGAGEGIVQGLKKAAPAVAESALNIRKLDRAYGKTPGRAILDETTGFTPSTVAESAQSKLNTLNPQLEQAADNASVRPRTRIAGLLQAPEHEVPLNNGINRGSTKGDLFSAEVNPEEPMEPRSGNPSAPIQEYPGINPHYLSGSEHPEMAGKFAPPSGVLRTRNPNAGARPVLDEFGRVISPQEAPTAAIPTTEPNRIASIGPARNVIARAFDTANRQGERTTLNQIQPMATHLSETVSGEPIANQITPRQLLDLKRGFGNEFIHRWNPETMEGVKGTAAQTYHQMGQEFNNAVPMAKELNSRISNLIPVAKRAESAELNAPTAQRVLHRVGAHTGALAGGIFGGYQGYERGGIPGAIAGGAMGLAIPEAISSPTGGLVIARGLNSPMARVPIRALTGSALQLGKPDRKNPNE